MRPDPAESDENMAMSKLKLIRNRLVRNLSERNFGPGMTDSMLFAYGAISTQKYLKCRSRIKKIERECARPATGSGGRSQFDISKIVRIREPLALISQIQRSGGSLLSQLFDNHPQVHAHPHELKIGFPKKYYWPRIDLGDSPRRWFLLLFEDIVLEHAKNGFKKGVKADTVHPFHFLPSLQKEIFLHYVNSAKPLHLRDVFDGYMTSYFNAWLNNGNLEGGGKKCVTGFTPRMAMFRENMDRFFEVYPDGKIISIVRDPKNWYPSASLHRPEQYGDISKAMRQWTRSIKATIRNKEALGESVCVIRFEDLISDTEAAMTHLSGFLGIEYRDTLLSPTHNGSPISANTSFTLEKPKIIQSTLDRYKTLRPEQLKTIESMTSDIYGTVLDKAVRL